MSFETSAYTSAGMALMLNALVGNRLTITGAYGGTGTASFEELTSAADVSGEKHTLQLLGIQAVGEGEDAIRRIPVRITGAETPYVLHQIGLFGRADDGKETLLAVYQDERGVEIPAISQDAGFELIFNSAIAISRTAKISLELDAEMSGLKRFLAQEVHDKSAHAIMEDIIIPTSAWVQDSSDADYGYTAKIAIKGCTEAHSPQVTVHKESFLTVRQAGICSIAQTIDGYLLLWAKSAPAADIRAAVLLVAPRSQELLDDEAVADTTSLLGEAVVGDAIVGM